MGPPGAQANQCETPCSDACNGSPTRRTQEVTCRSPTPESRRLSRPLSLPLSLSLSLPLPLPLPLPLSLPLPLPLSLPLPLRCPAGQVCGCG